MKTQWRGIPRLWSGWIVLALVVSMLPMSALPALAALPGDVVINEIMQNPSAVGDNAGEWFEIYNATGADIDINGWTMRDDDSNSHVIDNGGPLTIANGGYLVLGNNGDTSTNGGVAVDYSYPSNWYLGNSGDEVVLLDGVGAEIDRVEYDGGPIWPAPDGASMALRDLALDNNDAANWCVASTTYGAGDLGTPGSANDCPLPATTIPEIQGGVASSPLEGDVVTTEGIVYGVYGQGFFIADGEGAWHGLYVYNGSDAKPAVGDEVRVTGLVKEYHGLTQLAAPNYPTEPLVVDVLSSGHTPYGPAMVTAAEIESDNAASEPYESVFVEVHDLTVTAEIDAKGIWSFSDGSGATGKADDWGYRLEPAVGDTYAILRGALPYDWDEYKVMPRDENDVVSSGPDITTIPEIQGGVASSPLEGDVVTTEGIVYGVYGQGFFIADGEGAWHGLYVYNGSDAKPAVGDEVRVTGLVKEYHGLTQLAAPNYPTEPLVVDVLRSGNTPYGPAVVTAAEIEFDNAASEPYESVFVEVHDLTVTAEIDAKGIWSFSDGSGATGKADDWGYRLEPAVGDTYAILRGALPYDWDEYKVMPRDEDDILHSEPQPAIVINEVDSDTPGNDVLEFVEIYDGGTGNTSLDGLVVVLYNGNGDKSYNALDLDGFATDSGGYFLLGNSGVIPVPSITFGSNGLQNGADAVAIYTGNGSDFPSNTPVTTEGLVDAIVYDTNDGDDSGLLVLLNAGQPQVNEGGAGDKDNHSNQRCPNGDGGTRNTDSYLQKPPTPGAENACEDGPQIGECGDLATLIHEVQSSGPSSQMNGTSGVILEGVVIGDFQDTSTELGGFFLQEEDIDVDGDVLTSEGIFVYDDGFAGVGLGDVVRVMGTVHEHNGLTEIRFLEDLLVCGSGGVSPTLVTMPVPEDLEPYEGMLVSFTDLTASQNYFQGQYGQVTLSSGGRLFNPTNTHLPGTPAAIAMAAENLRRMVVLDDGQDADPWGDNPVPIPYIGADNTLRAGDTVPALTGVLDYGRISTPSSGIYHFRLHPTGEPVTFSRENHRTAQPADVGGLLKIAGFNVLNYFTTLDEGSNLCGPLWDQGCRGADSSEEFRRQRDKIISALAAIDADVVGLIELENHPDDDPLADLVSGLNDAMGADTYAYIATGAIGSDAIRTGFIYKPASVAPLGAIAILDASVDNRFLDDRNRPVLAQTFERSTGGGIFTAAVNHLKSKGSPCDGDPDTGDGQGNCNLTRTAAAEAMVDWLTTDPTGSGDPDVFIIGDLNAYAKEDPIIAITDGGYTNLVEEHEGPWAYSYTFDGQAGYLDHALATASAAGQVSGTTVWHINTDEPAVIDYDLTYKTEDLYTATPYRASDHDPVIVGFCEGEAPTLQVSVDPDTLWPPNHKYVKVTAEVVVSDNFDPATEFTLVSVTSSEPDSRQGEGDKKNDIVIVDDQTFELRAERFGTGEGRVYTITYRATDACGNSTEATATVTVPHDKGK